MSLEQRDNIGNISELIAENFGANSTYVEDAARWQSDPRWLTNRGGDIF
jgi:hypothetical protein